jgi:hypothetical protein
MRIIPTQIHGVIDYVVGIALLLAPNIFGFADVEGAAVLVPRIIGALIIGSALITKYELSVAKIIPMGAHLALDFAGGLLLAASPFLFDFSGHDVNVWYPHVIVGVAEMLIVLLSKSNPSDDSIA